MNVVGGKVLTQSEAELALQTLPAQILATLSSGRLHPHTVIRACDRLVRGIDEAAYLSGLESLGITWEMGLRRLHEVRALFTAEALEHRLVTELGRNYTEGRQFTSACGTASVRERLEPLGVLLHIAAGNANGLPAFSVLEGLLTGNINILKLPQVDGGLSAKLLLELIRIEPLLTDYIYVFDLSARDTESIGKLAELADSVVVWGGDAAVTALRTLVHPNTKLIEWGHKTSFAYVTAEGTTPEALAGLARHLCETNGLLCSSCQGIYLDSDNWRDVCAFCEQFLPILERCTAEIPAHIGIGTQAQIALQLYTAELENLPEHKIFRGTACSLTACGNPDWEPTLQYRNLWVKPLPRKLLLEIIRPHKGHLQTMGLLCGEGERDELTELLWRAGVVRVTSGQNMSATYLGEPHDGEYPLRRYMKIVSAW